MLLRFSSLLLLALLGACNALTDFDRDLEGTPDAIAADTLYGPDGRIDGGVDGGLENDGGTDAGPGLCDINTHVIGGECVDCDGGTINAAGNDPGGDDTQCQPRLCEIDERVDDDHECVACIAPATNAAGDDASGGETPCDGRTLCSSNQRVQDGACTDCEAGTRNDAGHDPTMNDTACVDILCLVDQRVDDHICVPCAPGSTAAADMIASGNNTSCENTECLADHYVDDHVCVACPGATTRNEGDDATGDDTRCEDACSPYVGVYCSEYADAYIKGDRPRDMAHFGHAVAVDGNLLVVGVPNDRGTETGINPSLTAGTAANVGAAYIFRRDPTGDWTQEAYLKPSVASANTQFGFSVAVDGETVVVGAPGDSSINPMAGSASVYIHGPSGWGLEGNLVAGGSPMPGLNLGYSVAIDGNNVLASAPNDMVDGMARAGSVYAFKRVIGTWRAPERIVLPSPAANQFLGDALAIDHNTFAVSAIETNASTGAVYVFTRPGVGMTWSSSTTPLYAPSGDPGDQFGASLALEGDRLVIGAPNDDSSATGVSPTPSTICPACASDSGAVHVATRSAGTWSFVAYLKPSNTGPGQWFGTSVALAGDHILVGSPREAGMSAGLGGDETQNGDQSGAAYLFRFDAGWSQRAYIRAPNPTMGDGFGGSVALTNQGMAIGARGDDGTLASPSSNGDPDSGSVFVRRYAP